MTVYLGLHLYLCLVLTFVVNKQRSFCYSASKQLA